MIIWVQRRKKVQRTCPRLCSGAPLRLWPIFRTSATLLNPSVDNLRTAWPILTIDPILERYLRVLFGNIFEKIFQSPQRAPQYFFWIFVKIDYVRIRILGRKKLHWIAPFVPYKLSNLFFGPTSHLEMAVNLVGQVVQFSEENEEFTRLDQLKFLSFLHG